MTEQKLITEEFWYGIYLGSWVQQYGEAKEFIHDTYPDATEKQIDKAAGIVQQRLLKLAKYE